MLANRGFLNSPLSGSILNEGDENGSSSPYRSKNPSNTSGQDVDPLVRNSDLEIKLQSKANTVDVCRALRNADILHS